MAKILFIKMGQPRLLFAYFRSFQTNNTIFTTNQSEKSHVHPVYGTRIQNPRPSEHESPPITTRPGLPPDSAQFLLFSFHFHNPVQHVRPWQNYA